MSEIDDLRAEVCEANRGLERHRLVALTWGNVSGITRDRSTLVIKPSGVPYAALRPEDMCVVDAASGHCAGSARPSTDTPIHRMLYRALPSVGGITHTHSAYACMFAQAERWIPCLGTTHADHFEGDIPVTRPLERAEVEGSFEEATGRTILDVLGSRDPLRMPAVLVRQHAPFCFGETATKSLENAVALEAVAQMAFGTLSLLVAPAGASSRQPLFERHHDRKHGPGAYYGQGR